MCAILAMQTVLLFSKVSNNVRIDFPMCCSSRINAAPADVGLCGDFETGLWDYLLNHCLIFLHPLRFPLVTVLFDVRTFFFITMNILPSFTFSAAGTVHRLLSCSNSSRHLYRPHFISFQSRFVANLICPVFFSSLVCHWTSGHGSIAVTSELYSSGDCTTVKRPEIVSFICSQEY